MILTFYKKCESPVRNKNLYNFQIALSVFLDIMKLIKLFEVHP